MRGVLQPAAAADFEQSLSALRLLQPQRLEKLFFTSHTRISGYTFCSDLTMSATDDPQQLVESVSTLYRGPGGACALLKVQTDSYIPTLMSETCAKPFTVCWTGWQGHRQARSWLHRPREAYPNDS